MTGRTMRALVLHDREKLEERSIECPPVHDHEVRVAVGAVGLCGTDFHIYEGRANYRTDDVGRPIPLSESPQILGHELAGTVVEAGRAVADLRAGDRVVVDQGLNCNSRREPVLCEYCATGDSHQCARYEEHGITTLPGALAEYIVVPAVNAVKIEGEVPFEQAALVEPLGCVIHASDAVAAAHARYRLGGAPPVRAVLVCGAGPAGLLFIQYLRRVLAYDGLLVVSEPDARRRQLATELGATAVDPSAADWVSRVIDLTGGERVNYLIEAAGVAELFREMPGLLRKQATVLLYGHGHRGVDLGVLNNVQFMEPTLVAAVGASGGFGVDRRPRTYRRALELIASGVVDVTRFVTHRYRSLAAVRRAFEGDRFEPGYIKGIAVWGDPSNDGDGGGA